MIFKYYAYDKNTKEWLDTKNYFSICPNKISIKSKEFVNSVYKLLSNTKIISMPFEYFALSDWSNKNAKTYCIYHITAARRVNIGKLYQLPTKENANTFGMIKPNIFSLSNVKIEPISFRNLTTPVINRARIRQQLGREELMFYEPRDPWRDVDMYMHHTTNTVPTNVVPANAEQQNEPALTPQRVSPPAVRLADETDLFVEPWEDHL